MNELVKKTIIKLKKVIDGSLLKSTIKGQWKYILFLELLAIIYISNRYRAEKVYIETARMNAELREQRSESILKVSKLMNISKEFEVEKLSNQKELGLHISQEPPKEIIIKNDDRED